MGIITGALLIAGIHYLATSNMCTSVGRSVHPSSPDVRSRRSSRMKMNRSPRMIRPQPMSLSAPLPPLDSEPNSPAYPPHPLESMFRFSRTVPPPIIPPIPKVQKELSPESAQNLPWSFFLAGMAVVMRIPGIFVQFFPGDTLQGAAGLMEALDLVTLGSVLFGGVWGVGTGLRRVFRTE